MDGAFPEESLQSVSLRDFSTVYFECAQTLEWTRLKPAFDAKSYGSRIVRVLCITLNAIKHRG